MVYSFSQKNLLSSSFLVLSLFLLSPEGKAMNEEKENIAPRNFNKLGINEIILSNIKRHVQPKLNIPFINGNGYKTLPMGYVPTYDQRSKLYSLSGAQYPKIPMIHRYHSEVLPAPFGAAFLGNEVVIPLSLKQYLGPKDQFFFLNIQQHDKNDTPLSLKPQYALFPEAPAASDTDHVARVGWTVVPGREGKIIPAQGETNQNLLNETVTIHPGGAYPNNQMVLSGDVMHLQGINTQKSMDCYSFIDANNANLVTYHWMLTPLDFEKFNQVLSVSNTLNELIHNLDKQRFLPKLLMELGKYVNYLPQIQPHVQPKLNVPFMSGESQFGDYKNLPMGYVNTYDTRSNLNSLKGCYPKISTIHTDNPDIESPPFGAAFLGNEVVIPLSLKQYLPPKDQFFFLNIQQHDKNGEPLSLKPQYALFPKAPTSSQETQKAIVGWTVIPGREGKIIPTQGETNHDLLKEEVSIHPTRENNPELTLSGNSMRLQGINTKKSMDCYSFVDEEKASLVTYHWMLTPHDFRNFSQALSVSDTLNELIYNLDHQHFLPNLLMELKRYVYYYPQIQTDVQPKLHKEYPVHYGSNKDIEELNLPTVCKGYPTIGDGNCFFHAVFTKDGHNAEAMTNWANQIRANLPEIVKNNPFYIEIMRKELLVEYKQKVINDEVIGNFPLYQLIQAEIEQNIPMPDDMLLEYISNEEVLKYLERYIINSGFDSYIEIPVGRDMEASIANVIADYLKICINCFQYDSRGYLVYVGSVGPKNAPQKVSILLDGLHYTTLDHSNETEERKAGIRQAALNATEEVFMTSDWKSEKKETSSPSVSKNFDLPKLPEINYGTYCNELYEGLYEYKDESSKQIHWDVVNADSFGAALTGKKIEEDTQFNLVNLKLLPVDDINEIIEELDKNNKEKIYTYKNNKYTNTENIDGFRKVPKKYIKLMNQIQKSLGEDETAFFSVFELTNDIPNEPIALVYKVPTVDQESPLISENPSNQLKLENVISVDEKPIPEGIKNLMSVTKLNDLCLKVKERQEKEITPIKKSTIVKFIREELKKEKDLGSWWFQTSKENREYLIELCTPKEKQPEIEPFKEKSNERNTDIKNARLEVEKSVEKWIREYLPNLVKKLQLGGDLRSTEAIIKDFFDNSLVNAKLWNELSLGGKNYLIDLCEGKENKDIIFENINISKNEKSNPYVSIISKPKLPNISNKDYRPGRKKLAHNQTKQMFSEYNVYMAG
ncbi:MAG: hypothetical protein KBD90_01120, partial [Alphaproteobacteria bacterium]|nr:hypothetical protein [Alphaproteobacteria bacterium]